ncbi:MAG: nucleotide sugar dehydrogenase [Thaumarchaeota archaeon]|nr:MAG: nucleotide sugar dehydrogenase [Nitrososphaerota archaeon]
MTTNSFFSSVDSFSENLSKNNIKVCVIGIGRIGLPTALSFANKNLSTIGVDINTELVNSINSGKYPLDDEPEFDKIFDKVTKNKFFSATDNISEALTKSNVVILSLPTPMDKNCVPNYSALFSVAQDLHDFIQHETLIIIESTVEPGFIEDEFIKIVEGKNKKLTCNIDFSIVACPETANPGEIFSDFHKLPRLIGGFDEKFSQITAELYHYVFNVEIIHLPNCKTANAAKLTANVFRDVNIAFINELAMLFEKMDIDIIKVIEACDRKYNFQAHYPGSGVGGPCLPVNSYQYLNTARKTFDGVLRMIETAREINEHMPHHTVEIVVDALNESEKSIKNSNIGILGISYKPNVADIQLSPAEEIVKHLEQLGAKIKIYDPFYKSQNIFSHMCSNSFDDVVENSDALILVTAHDEFKNIDPKILFSKMNTPIFVDTRGIMNIESAKKSGLIFRGIGRGGR